MRFALLLLMLLADATTLAVCADAGLDAVAGASLLACAERLRIDDLREGPAIGVLASGVDMALLVAVEEVGSREADEAALWLSAAATDSYAGGGE